MSLFGLPVFVSFPSRSVRASTVAPTCGFANLAALHSSAPHRFVSESFHILSFALWIDFCNSALTWAVAADLHLILFSFSIWLPISWIFPFHHHVYWAKIVILLAVASVIMPSASLDHSDLLSSLWPVLSTLQYAISLAHSMVSFSAFS